MGTEASAAMLLLSVFWTSKTSTASSEGQYHAVPPCIPCFGTSSHWDPHSQALQATWLLTVRQGLSAWLISSGKGSSLA